jgi:hypothetical protein
MAESAPRTRALERLASLPWIVAWGLAVRLAAVAAVQVYLARKGRPWVFDDTAIYWGLAGQIRAGGPYVVDQWGVPHYALRTPGYPLFLAACRVAFGGSLPAVRLVQAALGAGCILLLARLVATVRPEEANRPGWSAPRLAAAWAATDPLVAVLSAVVLSEALFVPLMLAMLWGLAALWPSGRPRPWLALGVGAATGGAILVRPSWAAVAPLLLLAWVVAVRRVGAIRDAAMVAVGAAAVMAPWWARNAQVLGRFVPTALWAGASLYDGLNPGATGASDMRFLEDPEVRALGEVAQDAALRDRAIGFAREHPGRALRLAAAKAARFWSPWPNAEEFRAAGPAGVLVRLAGAAVTIPFYAMLLVGAWACRRDARALVVLLGPLLGFAAVHMIFVSSIRYRIPAAVPALGLAAIGLRSALDGRLAPTADR